jgi:hypothetical protein
VNRFDAYITDYLYENKEVALEKIGFIKIKSFAGNNNTQSSSVEFTYDKRITTSTALIEYIAQKLGKNKNLIASDLESHFMQVMQFINMGKPYEIPEIGFIKANKNGVYEFTPFSETNKPVRTGKQQVKRSGRNNNRAAVQVISLIIVILILSGLSWQAYQVFSKKQNNAAIHSINNSDTITSTSLQDTHKTADTTLRHTVEYSPNDTVNIRYIYETTASGLRAHTRTAQLKSFGNNANYDSFMSNHTMFYHLFIIKPTKLADTATIKDSIGKFLMRDIILKIDSTKL